jgi:hypothetical protein
MFLKPEMPGLTNPGLSLVIAKKKKKKKMSKENLAVVELTTCKESGHKSQMATALDGAGGVVLWWNTCLA